VLKIIAELSPCSESKLLIVAANHGLERFGDGSLGDLSKLLGQCVQELQARRLVEITGEQLVIAPPASAEEEDILDLTAEPAGSAEDEDILNLTTEPARSAEDEDILDLTTEPARSAEDEDILDLTAEPARSAEDEDILDLTAELELRPPKLDEVSTNRKRANPDDAWEEPRAGAPQTKAQVTDGTERSPEPTSEEIIAAMRQFISDDQTS
jgi:hypothetical protein